MCSGPTIKLFSLLLHNRNFATVTNRNVNSFGDRFAKGVVNRGLRTAVFTTHLERISVCLSWSHVSGHLKIEAFSFILNILKDALSLFKNFI